MTRRVAAVLLTACAVALCPAVALGAEFGIPPDSLSIRTIDGEGNPDNRAGAHPDRLQIEFGLTVGGTGTTARDLLFELSPGLGSNADAVPRCPREVFEEEEKEEKCPPETQVGVITQEQGGEDSELPIFNVEPAPSEAAAFGVRPLWKITMVAELSPKDFGLTLAARDLPQFPLGGGVVELWGVPADHQEGTSIPRRAFLTTPTRCGPLEATFRVRSWQIGAPWLSQIAKSDAPLGGCEALPFEPKLGFTLSNPVADSPSGAQLELTMPREDDPDGRAYSQIEDASIALPEGVSVSPGGAEGIAACSDAQFGLGDGARASCPPSSKVGSVTLESPQSREPLTGNVYLGAEHPGDRFRMLMAVSGPGAAIKLASSLRANPATGRLSVVLSDLPQAPIERMALSFDGGPRALLATPLACGSSTATGTFEPHSGGSTVTSTASSAIVGGPSGAPCPDAPPFAPRLVAGSSDARAGRPTSFSVTMGRQDGEQLPSRFSVTLPPGLSAAVGTVKPCPEPAVPSGACPTSSRVGSALAELGSGPNPAVLHGEAYLTDPYRRAPFGIALVFPARVGPFDLGKLVVRGMLRLDGRTGQVTIETDSLPQVVEGVPARIRTIGIDMDRPGFARNPTSCEPTSVNATIRAAGGASATAATPFALVGCKKLGFKPRFSLAMVGRSELHEGGKPGLSVSAKLQRGNTNLKAMKLSLPEELQFTTSGLRELCSHRDAAQGVCSDGSRIGSVVARTPLLGRQLRGGIFIARPEGDGFPDLWLGLSSMGVHLALRGELAKSRKHFAINLMGLPDMPLSTLEMRLPGGPDGALSLGSGLCAQGKARRLFSPVAARGQDGAYREMRVRVRAVAHCGAEGRTE